MGKQNLCKHFLMIPSKLGKLEIALDSVQSGTQPGLFEECPVAQSRGVTYCTGQQNTGSRLNSSRFKMRYLRGSVCHAKLNKHSTAYWDESYDYRNYKSRKCDVDEGEVF